MGERRVLAGGIAIVAVSTGLAGLAQSYAELLVLRGLGGIGSAMFTISATALLFRVASPSSRGRANGLFQSGFLVGGLLGPLAGGFLTDYSLRLPFYVYAVSLVAAGAIAFVFLAGTRLRPRGQAVERSSSAPAVVPDVAQEVPSAAARGESTSLRQAWAHPSYRAAVTVNFAIGWAFFGVRMSLIPLFVTEALHESAVWIGVGFLCTSLAQVTCLMVAGRYVDRAGRRPAMMIGCLVAAAALGSLAVASNLPVFLVAMTALGVGGAFVSTAPGAVVGDVMRGRGGRVVAVFQMASDAGTISGPLAAGVLADSLSFRTAFLACAVVVVAGFLAAVRMPETLARAEKRLPSGRGAAQRSDV